MLGRHKVNYALLAFVLDALGVIGAFLVAKELRTALPLGNPELTVAALPRAVVGIALLIWSITFFAFSVYDPERRTFLAGEILRILAASLFALLVLAGILYFSFRDTARLLIIYFYICDSLWMIFWRVGVHTFGLVHPQPEQTRNVVIVGANELGEHIARVLEPYSWSGLHVRGFLDELSTSPISTLPVLGPPSDIRAIVKTHRIDEVIIALPHHQYDQLDGIVTALQTLAVHVHIVPNYPSLALFRPTVEHLEDVPLINLRESALSTQQRLVKRAFDLAAGLALTLAALPFMAVVAAAIRLDSPGPIIFKQLRVGENGRLFTMYKFRSMVANADADTTETEPSEPEETTGTHKTPDDPRVTRIGRFIRRTSIDELPQFFNVLLGTMSLVGPRPEMPWLVEKYQDWQYRRFAVPPGMTGWWQVNGRSGKPMHLHTEDDLYYIENYSLRLDVVILWKTIFVVLNGQGAF
ncbi:MAG: sugar transferase [Burkholderiales bacterium]|nr:sugar transferase [Anaerolineae bacterium]